MLFMVIDMKNRAGPWFITPVIVPFPREQSDLIDGLSFDVRLFFHK